MIYYATTKDLMQEYSKLSKHKIDNTNFVVLSNRIRITKDRPNVLSATHLMINGGELRGVGLDVPTDSSLARDQFKFFLLKNPKSLALVVNMIECDIGAGEDSLLLCSPEELKVGYMQTIADVVYDLFHYEIHHYPKEPDFDPEDTIKRVLYYKKQIKKLKFKMMSDGELMRYIQRLPKKKLKKELKRRGENIEGLTRKEMEQLFFDYVR